MGQSPVPKHNLEGYFESLTLHDLQNQLLNLRHAKIGLGSPIGRASVLSCVENSKLYREFAIQ